MKEMQRALLLVLALQLGQPASAGQVAAVRQAAAPLGSAAGLAGTWHLSGAPTLQSGQFKLAAPALTNLTPIPQLAAAAIPVVAAAAAPAAAPPAAQAQQTAPAAPRLADSLPQTVARDLKVAKDSPALERYLILLERLRRSWGRPPFETDDLLDAQRAVAAEAGLDIKSHPGLIEISPEGGHWLNRWAKGLHESKGVRLYWSPLHNHYDGANASYNSKGYIMADALGPLLTRPDPQLFHEFLHAYVDRGRYSQEFEPLRTSFISFWSMFPKREGRESAGYSHSFQADEILTTLHTAFDYARKITRLYGTGRAGWTTSPLKTAPQEVQELVGRLDNPIYLAESVREMSAQLLPGALKAAREGLAGRPFKKSYGRLSGAIPDVGEVEANEKAGIGFYEARVGDIDILYNTMARLRKHSPDNDAVFPVFLSRNGYAVQVELSLIAVSRLDLDDPRAQEAIASDAIRLAIHKLAHLQRVTGDLAPDIARLKALQARARRGVDVGLVRQIQDASKAAFLKTVFYFIRQGARAQA